MVGRMNYSQRPSTQVISVRFASDFKHSSGALLHIVGFRRCHTHRAMGDWDPNRVLDALIKPSLMRRDTARTSLSISPCTPARRRPLRVATYRLAADEMDGDYTSLKRSGKCSLVTCEDSSPTVFPRRPSGNHLPHGTVLDGDVLRCDVASGVHRMHRHRSQEFVWRSCRKSGDPADMTCSN